NRQRKGANWLKTTLVQCAFAAAKKKGSYLQAQFHRLKARRGPKKAIMAVVASILTAIYHMLKDGTMYHDLGCDHFKRHSTDQQKKATGQALVRAWLCSRTQAPHCMSLRHCRGVCGTILAGEFPLSSPSGLAGPAAHETLLLCGCVVGTEVD